MVESMRTSSKLQSRKVVDRVWVIKLGPSWYELRVGPKCPTEHTDKVSRSAIDENGQKVVVDLKSTVWIGGSVLYPIQANAWARFAGEHGLPYRVDAKPYCVPEKLTAVLLDPQARSKWFKRGHE